MLYPHDTDHATKPTYEELEREVAYLRAVNSRQAEAIEELAKFQPPAPVYLNVSQCESVLKWLKESREAKT